jgi:hypothetical protein
MDHKQNHDMHQDMGHDDTNTMNEYLKFFGILGAITAISTLFWHNTALGFLDAFMGVFFVVFAGFKLAQLKEFAYGFQSYDLIAKKSLKYSYSYPFAQLALGVLYLAGAGSLPLDVFVVVISLVSAAGVLNSLIKKQAIHCVCLGNVIKLPLSRISFVEDFGMAAMAVAMILTR